MGIVQIHERFVLIDKSIEVARAAQDLDKIADEMDAKMQSHCQLLQAAPYLLSACSMMLRLLEDNDLDEHFDGESEVLRDAINQAIGGCDE